MELLLLLGLELLVEGLEHGAHGPFDDFLVKLAVAVSGRSGGFGLVVADAVHLFGDVLGKAGEVVLEVHFDLVEFLVFLLLLLVHGGHDLVEQVFDGAGALRELRDVLDVAVQHLQVVVFGLLLQLDHLLYEHARVVHAGRLFQRLEKRVRVSQNLLLQLLHVLLQVRRDVAVIIIAINVVAVLLLLLRGRRRKVEQTLPGLVTHVHQNRHEEHHARQRDFARLLQSRVLAALVVGRQTVQSEAAQLRGAQQLREEALSPRPRFARVVQNVLALQEVDFVGVGGGAAIANIVVVLLLLLGALAVIVIIIRLRLRLFGGQCGFFLVVGLKLGQLLLLLLVRGGGSAAVIITITADLGGREELDHARLGPYLRVEGSEHGV